MKIELDLTKEQFDFLSHLVVCKFYELNKKEDILLVGRDFSNDTRVISEYEKELEFLKEPLAQITAIFEQFKKYKNITR